VFHLTCVAIYFASSLYVMSWIDYTQTKYIHCKLYIQMYQITGKTFPD